MTQIYDVSQRVYNRVCGSDPYRYGYEIRPETTVSFLSVNMGTSRLSWRLLLVAFVAVGFLTVGTGLTTSSTAPQTDDINPIGADDVLVNESAVTQEVSFTATLDENSTREFQVDLTDIGTAGVPSRVVTLSVSGPGSPDATNSSITQQGIHTFDVVSRGSSSQNTAVTVTVQYEHNTTTLSPADVGPRSITLTSAGSDATTSVSFDAVYDPTTVTRSPTSDLAFNQTVVYAGEEDVRFVAADGSTVAVSSLRKTAGDNEGAPLQIDESTDPNTGRYATKPDGSGFSVVLQEPRITTGEVQFESTGEDVGSISRRADSLDGLVVTAAWNFPEAESLEVSVTGPSGNDVTDEVLTSAVLNDTNGEDSTSLDMSGEDPGTYSIDFEGVDGLGGQSYSFTLLAADDFAVDTDKEHVTQGNYANISITGGLASEYHLVTVDAKAFRDAPDTETQLFRDVEDTETVGYVSADGATSANVGLDVVNASNAAYAYAVLQIDETDASGQIDTALLRDTDVTIEVYGSGGEGTFYDPETAIVLDDTELTVREATVELTEPSTRYTIGQPVDVAGDAAGVDTVRLYAYDQGVWLPVEVDGRTQLTVDGNGTFSVDDVDLAAEEAPGNDVVSFAGQYRLGVIDDADVTPTVTAGRGTTGAIDQPTFVSAVSDQQPLVAEVGELSAEFETYDEAVAAADGSVSVTGIAPTDTVVVVFVDDRGNTIVRTVAADRDPINLANTFEEQDVPISSLSRGTVAAYVVSSGRDEQFGDGNRVTDTTELEAYLTEGENDTREQVRERLVAATTGPNASDDQLVSARFRLTDARVSIDRVGPLSGEATSATSVDPGEPILVEGTTNRNPDDAALTVELLNDEYDAVEQQLVRSWDTSGSYTVRLDTTGLDPGTYTVSVTDLQVTDQVSIGVGVAAPSTQEQPSSTASGANASTDLDPTDSAAAEANATEPSPTIRTEGSDTTPNTTRSNGSTAGDTQTRAAGDAAGTGQTPDESASSHTVESARGFGVVLAGIACLLAGLLAARRMP